jgi:hypothetical protein
MDCLIEEFSCIINNSIDHLSQYRSMSSITYISQGVRTRIFQLLFCILSSVLHVCIQIIYTHKCLLVPDIILHDFYQAEITIVTDKPVLHAPPNHIVHVMFIICVPMSLLNATPQVMPFLASSSEILNSSLVLCWYHGHSL